MASGKTAGNSNELPRQNRHAAAGADFACGWLPKNRQASITASAGKIGRM